MSLYKKLKKENARRFQIDVTSNIDPCKTCVVKDVKSVEHCGKCDHNPFVKSDVNSVSNNHLNSSVLVV